MARADDVKRIVAGGRAKGLTDDQIRALVKRYDERSTAAPEQAPEPQEQVPAERPGVLAEMVSNIGPSAQRVLGGVHDAVAQWSQDSRDPRAQMAAASERPAPIVGILDHYRDRYGSAEGREHTVRTDPVGMALDMLLVAAGATKAPAMARAARSGAQRGVQALDTTVAGATRFAEKHPAVGVLAGAAVGGATGGPYGALMGAAGGRATPGIIKLLTRQSAARRSATTPKPPSPDAVASRRMVDGMSEAARAQAPTASAPAPMASHAPTAPTVPPPAPPATTPPVATRAPSQPAPSAPPSTQMDALVRELAARDINWRTTDAVPIDAIKRDVSKGGTIIEAGESQIALGERIAVLMKKGTPEALAEAERLSKALRQRMHIRAGATRR